MSISYNDYQKIARKTSATDDLTILALGLIGESVEVRVSIQKLQDYSLDYPLLKAANNLSKELGDVLWYTARIYDIFGEPFHNWRLRHFRFTTNGASLPSVITADHLIEIAAVVSEHIKKVNGHGHDMDRDLVLNALSDIVRIVRYFAELIHGHDGDCVILDENVDKLCMRYPNGFSTEKSVQRIDVEQGDQNA